MSKFRRAIAGVAALAVMIGMCAVMIVAPPLAWSDATNQNKLAGLEKSLVLLQTKWTGYVLIPAYASKNGVAGYTKQLSYYITCTGWYVSKTAQIVTAGHCVDPAQGRRVILTTYLQEQNATDYLKDALANWTVDGGTVGQPVIASVEALQPQGVDGATITSPTTVGIVDFKPTDNGDVALLQVPNMAKETPPLMVAETAPQVGDPITSIGFPGEVREISDQSQIARASFKTGSVSSLQVTPQGVTTIEVSTPLIGGMSGGPTVNQNGEVVGVNSSGLNDQAEFNFITNTADLRTFLASHNISLARPAAPPKATGMLWYVIGGGAALALVLGGAAALLLIQHRRHMHGADPANPVEEAATSTQTGPANPAAVTIASADAPITPLPDYPSDRVAGNGALAQAGSHGNTEPAGSDTLTAVARYCSACGAEHRDTDRFCPACGKPTV